MPVVARRKVRKKHALPGEPAVFKGSWR